MPAFPDKSTETADQSLYNTAVVSLRFETRNPGRDEPTAIKEKEAQHQKEIVEEKQKEILDSIRYAKRIQQSLLPTEKYIDKKFKELKK